jgi:hypothetical protein
VVFILFIFFFKIWSIIKSERISKFKQISKSMRILIFEWFWNLYEFLIWKIFEIWINYEFWTNLEI